MKIKTLVGARQFSIASAAALAVSLAVAGGAGASPWNGSHNDGRPVPVSSQSPSASVANNTLTIEGTDGSDNISIPLATATPNTLTVDLDNNGTPDQHFDTTTFSAISVFLKDGDDQFAVVGTSPTQPLTVDGSSGNDTITTGSGNDVISGGSGSDIINSGAGDDVVNAGSGDDVVTGGTGHDSAVLGSGNDSFVWNPGDGSDFVSGRSGFDTLVFNGAAASEQMSLSANDHQSLFLRQPGNVRMDMDGVEQLNLAALGGPDTVAINDMTATDFQRANIDLSSAGVPDGQVDNVTVNGTNDGDHVRVNADHGRVDVEGLSTETRITGSDPTDHLQVNTLGERDRVNVDPGVSPILGLGVDLGSGQS